MFWPLLATIRKNVQHYKGDTLYAVVWTRLKTSLLLAKPSYWISNQQVELPQNNSWMLMRFLNGTPAEVSLYISRRVST
jgi:hypothetical protein